MSDTIRSYERFTIKWDKLPAGTDVNNPPVHRQIFYLSANVKRVVGMFVFADLGTFSKAEMGVMLDKKEVLPKEWNVQLMMHNSLVPLRDVIVPLSHVGQSGNSIVVDIELRRYLSNANQAGEFYLYVIEEV